MKEDPMVRVVDRIPGYPVVEIEHPLCSARVALHGAHVMSWRPRGEEEVLYLSPDAIFKEGTAIRGGIPICWPWFNAHPTNPDLPSHGLVRTRFWNLDSQSADEEGVTLRMVLGSDDWEAVATITLGRELEVSIESHNLSDLPMMVSGALHTYLQVSDIEKIVVRGLEGSDYLDTVGERRMRRREGAITIDREVDRIYNSSHTTRLEDEVLGRAIVVEKDDSPSTVVWNPWVEKAAALGDLPDEGFRKFLCIEAAIANDKAPRLEKGGIHRLATRIRIE